MATAAIPALDLESREWLHDLRAGGTTADAAIERLRALLLDAARFEVKRRRDDSLLVDDSQEIAREAADDALTRILKRLHDFGSDRRFTTWASKFALTEAAVKLRRHAWAARDLPLESEGLDVLLSVMGDPDATPEHRAVLEAVQIAMPRLTAPQRRVFIALALNGIPIDVLAEQMRTSRGALYKTLHEARREVRKAADSGIAAG
jgi:RNA polymerase sigma-70 factor, ECF subfamily